MYHVAVDNAANATEHIVYHGENSEYQHGAEKTQAGDQVDDDGHTVHRDCAGERTYKLEQPAQGQASGHVEAALEVAVDGYELEVPKHRHHEEHQHDHCQRDRQFVLQPDQAAADGERDERRRAQDAVGRALGGHDRKPHGPGTDLPAADIVVFPIELAAGQPRSHPQQRHAVAQDDQPVGVGEFSRHGGLVLLLSTTSITACIFHASSPGKCALSQLHVPGRSYHRPGRPLPGPAALPGAIMVFRASFQCTTGVPPIQCDGAAAGGCRHLRNPW